MIRDFGAGDIIYLIFAARWTLALTALAFAGGAVVGLALAVARIAPSRLLRFFAAAYIQIVQGTPLLVWLFVFYFGLSIAGLSVNAWTAAAFAYSIYGGAFLGEIWRGALMAVAPTQWEAGASLGLTYAQQMRHIIIPQAIRIATPPTIGFLVQLIKNTSLAATIGFVELTREGQLTSASTYKPFAVYVTVACIYFLICFPLTSWSRQLEERFHVAR